MQNERSLSRPGGVCLCTWVHAAAAELRGTLKRRFERKLSGVRSHLASPRLCALHPRDPLARDHVCQALRCTSVPVLAPALPAPAVARCRGLPSTRGATTQACHRAPIVDPPAPHAARGSGTSLAQAHGSWTCRSLRPARAARGSLAPVGVRGPAHRESAICTAHHSRSVRCH